MTETTFHSRRRLRLLVADRQLETAQLIKSAASALGHPVVCVASAPAAVQEAGERAFDAIFLDLETCNRDWVDTIRRLRAHNAWAQIFMTTTGASVSAAVEAMKVGASDFLCKPLTAAQIRALIQRVADDQSLARGPASVEQAISRPGPTVDFSTESPSLREAIEIARQAARGSTPMLIQGEPGVGKRTLARAIHAWSDRAARPLAVTGCRAPSSHYLEVEWFGALKTAKDGNVTTRSGRIDTCDSGTLLIEDIDLLPAPLQPRLLRLIEHGEYERAGDFAIRKASIRILATTSVDLAQCVRANAFDPQLLSALGGAAIFLPPLRHRPQDTVMLAERYLAFFARHTRRNVVSFSHGATDSLRRHSWPGNIRELRNLIERTVLIARNVQIETSDFPQGSLNRVNAAALGDPVPLERIEELHIRGVLAAATSIEAAAVTLGIDAATLWRRRKRYGI